MQGSLDGTNWVNIGAAATTFTSTSVSLASASTTNVFRLVRIQQRSMVTKSSMKLVGFITGL